MRTALSVAASAACAALLVLWNARAGEGVKDDGAKLGPELLANGDFEKGAATPESWDEVDDLTNFYVGRPGGTGKCLKFDSDVYDREAKARYEEMKLPGDKRPGARPKTPPAGKKYDTIAGLGGALLWSDYVEIEHGAAYRLAVEVNTYAPEVKVFLKGYVEHEGERRINYKKYLTCFPQDKKELGSWKYYSTNFAVRNPYNEAVQFKWLKVMFMVFWPPGEAYADNVSIRKIVEPPDRAEKTPEPGGSGK